MRTTILRVTRLFAVTALVAGLGLAVGQPALAAAPSGGVNDPSCRPSEEHPNPVVLLHGLGATYYEDLNFLQGWLADRGYCTYSKTYGAFGGIELVGGLRPIATSAKQIAGQIEEVRELTGADEIDLVGHSEGGFHSLYVPKTQDGIAEHIGKVVAIAPPTHGTTFAGLYNLAYVFGQDSRDAVDRALRTVGCPACSEIGTGGSAIATLNDGPITRPGIDYTVITSRNDQLVTPTETAFVREPGVDNRYVQDVCPADRVGHIGEAYDTNVWNMVANALESQRDRRFTCGVGFPG